MGREGTEGGREGGCDFVVAYWVGPKVFFFFLWKRDKTVRGRLPCGWCTFIFWLCRLSLLSALSIPVLAPPVHPLKSGRALFFVRLFAWACALPRTPMRRRAVLHCCIDEPREVLSASGREVAASFQEKGVICVPRRQTILGSFMAASCCVEYCVFLLKFFVCTCVTTRSPPSASRCFRFTSPPFPFS